MKTLNHTRRVRPMAPSARTAADLMTPNALSIRRNMSVLDAANFLAVRGMIAVPVVDETVRPVGVLRSSDIRKHRAQRPAHPEAMPNRSADHQATVSDIMTRDFYAVRPETPAVEVIEKMLALKVRRLLVVDGLGIFIGAISTHDTLRELRRWSANASIDISA